MYYYIKNLQGDVVKIIDRLGNTKVTYTYDAWGKVLSQTDTSIYNLANLNPFRYRGYVYDYQTGLYYLQSRYYDPITGRFLNADIYADTGKSVLSTNVFAYCENNTVNYIDKFGHSRNASWNTQKTCPVEARAIELNILSKSDLQGFLYCGMYYDNGNVNGYEIYTYNGSYDSVNNGVIYSVISIYAMRKSTQQWRDYSYQTWGWFEDTVNAFRIGINSVAELFSFLNEDYMGMNEIKNYVPLISGIATIINTFTGTPYKNNFVKYIENQNGNPNNWVATNTYLILLKCVKSITIKYFDGGEFTHVTDTRYPF